MSREYFKNLLDKFFLQARAQFGSAVKSQWLYEGEACPGCGGAVGAVKTKGGDVLSLNAFIYRERGVLIGYVLCNKCAKHIFRATKKNPYQETPLHAEIEKNLVEGYKHYLATMNNA